MSIYEHYERSQKKSIPWPEEWCNLDKVPRAGGEKDLYIFNLDKKFLNKFFKMMERCGLRQAFEFKGRQFALFYRIKFPNLKTF